MRGAKHTIKTMFGSYSRTGLKGPVYFCAAIFFGMSASPVAAELPAIPLTVGPQSITAEVAADDASRSKGLMFRESLPDNHGMLFVFDRADQYCFWMKNTPLPLSIAFIGEDGRIINLADMQPLSLDAHCALAPARYALEMKQDWFKNHQIAPGTALQGLP